MIDYAKGDFVKRTDVDSFVKDNQIYQVENLMHRKGQEGTYLIECKDHNGVPCFFEPSGLFKVQAEVNDTNALGKRPGEKLRHLCSSTSSSTKPETKGVKYDPDKLQYSLIPPYALEEVARNLTIGLKKYPHRDNWKLVQDAEQRYLDALLRHTEAHRKGEVFDPDHPGVYHLAAVAVNAMFLLEFMTNPELDSKVFNKE